MSATSRLNRGEQYKRLQQMMPAPRVVYQQHPRGADGNRPARRAMKNGHRVYETWPRNEYTGGAWVKGAKP